ncbi:MAG: M14 family zinc carboxypeptidase [Cyclonatronaceae bacterium]
MNTLYHSGSRLLFLFPLTLFLLAMTHESKAEEVSTSFAQRFYESYDSYRETALTHRRFKHHDIVPLIRKLGEHPDIALKGEGYSTEGREIFRLTMGSGDIQVLLWSQMHGNEPTATMALFDLFNFLSADDGFNDIRREILSRVTIHAVPMLNPDGSERYQRRTAFGIDMNRDALRLQAPESQILKRLRDETGADFGFNLHDQSIRYSAGDTPKSTIIAFLAPAYDEERSINPVRRRSMQLIAQLDEMLQAFIPGHVAAYSDEFEPRAFGDNIQKWGTSTILVESGGFKGDPEKQYIRKMNYLLLMESLRSIARGGYETHAVEQYEAIPSNRFRLHSVIFRNLTVPFREYDFQLDLAMNRTEVNINGATGFYNRGAISELGDLSTFNGFEEFDATGLRLDSGMVYPHTFATEYDLEKVDPLELMREGYTAVRIEEPSEGRYTRFPLNILGPNARQPSGFKVGRPANLVLRRGDEVAYIVVNGFVVDVAGAVETADAAANIGNALIYR